MEQTIRSVSRRPGRRFSLRLGRGGRVPFFIVAVAALAFTLYAGALQELSAPTESVRIPWWGLALIFLVAEAFPVHLHFRSEAHSLSLSEVGLVLGLFFTSPGGLLLAQLCGACLALTLIRRQRPLKVTFNLAQFALNSCLGILAFHAVAGLGDPAGPAGWAGALVGTGMASLSGVLLVSSAIWLAAGSSTLRALPRVCLISLMSSLACASLALAAVALVQADPRTLWVLLVPAAGCALAFRAYTAQRRRHEHLEFLYRSMRAMQGAPELRSAVHSLLDAARTMLAAELVEIILFHEDGDGSIIRSVAARNEERLMESAQLTDAGRAALQAVSSQQGALLLPQGHEPHVVDAYLGEQGVRDAMLIALRGENRILGMLLAGDRAGDVATFTDEDRKLFETFASHAGVLLENDRVKEQLRHQAFHDALTGLPNRVLFSQQVGEALAWTGAGGNKPTVLFLDLDDFKTINDSLGHSAGDQLLVAVAERVRACVHPGDTAARLGGDEFAILLAGERADQADRTAERLVEALQAPFVLDGRQMTVHASIGIADGESGAATAEELLRNADVAMYSAKANGKRTYAVYEAEMHARVRRRHELAAALDRAVERDEICVFYQPIVALADDRVVAVEALARWRHPDRGLVTPGSFIPLAEETGLIGPIGRTVLRTACAKARAWQVEFGSHAQLAVSVNLSPAELQNPQLCRDVADVLSVTGLAPESLMLEITESGAMRDPDATIETCRALQALGIRLALDDFGTGHSSLSHLREFPIDIIKVAKPFIDRLDGEAFDTAFVDAILRLADALDLQVVAEGIERPEQVERLRRLSCPLGQGFYFARPLHETDAGAVLGAARAVTSPFGTTAAAPA